MSIKLRPYQTRDYKSIVESFKSHSKILYQCPTGGGKSVVISQLIMDNKDKRILFLSHKIEIITQMLSRLEDSGIKPGFVASTTSSNLDSNILIGSISTLMRDKRIESLLDKAYDLIIIDEAHRTRAGGYEKVLDHLFELNPKTKLFGVTATPYRTDNKELKKYYNDLIISDDIDTLVKSGYLADFITYQTKIEDIDKEVKKSGEDYQLTSLSQYMRKQQYLDHLVESYRTKGEDKQMIVFCVDKVHARSVLENYKSKGYKSIEYIDSDTPPKKRENILQQYRDKTLKIIVCIETMTEGVDLPDTGVIQLARPTKSLILYLQMLGRGTRPKQDGSKLIILDCAGSTMEHGVLSSKREWSLNHAVNPSHLRKKNKIIAKREDGTFTDNVDEMDLLELVEVDPMEYIMKLGMDTSKAEEANKKILNERYDILEEIGKYIIKHAKTGVYSLERGSFFSFENLRFKLTSSTSSYTSFKQNISLDTSYSWGSEGRSRLKSTSFFGDLAKVLLNDKHFNFIEAKVKAINELKDEIIDVNSIKNQIQQFKESQFEVELENYIQHNRIMVLPSKRSINFLFPREWYGYFDKIEFTKNKLNKTQNEIKLWDGERIVKTKSIGLDKLKDLLFNKWEETKEVNKGIESQK